MKHIAFTIDEKFVRFCAVTMVSVLEHNEPSDVMFHVVSDGISQTACDTLSQLAARKGAFIAFYTVPAEAMKGYSIRWEGKRLSMVVFYRCILASLLPESVSKVLYLDCDILVLDNIDELWNTDISGKALAAVPDSFIVNPVHCRRLHYDVSFNYFNGGVLLLTFTYFSMRKARALIAHGAQITINGGRVTFPTVNKGKVEYDSFLISDINYIKDDEKENQCKVSLPDKYIVFETKYFDSWEQFEEFRSLIGQA